MKKYAVFQSSLAELKFLKLLKHLENKWGHQSKLIFIEKFKTSINSISIMPRSFPKSQINPEIFKCVVTPQTTIYYRIVKDEIEIITLMDNRRDQAILFKEIKKHFE